MKTLKSLLVFTFIAQRLSPCCFSWCYDSKVQETKPTQTDLAEMLNAHSEEESGRIAESVSPEDDIPQEVDNGTNKLPVSTEEQASPLSSQPPTATISREEQQRLEILIRSINDEYKNIYVRCEVKFTQFNQSNPNSSPEVDNAKQLIKAALEVRQSISRLINALLQDSSRLTDESIKQVKEKIREYEEVAEKAEADIEKIQTEQEKFKAEETRLKDLRNSISTEHARFEGRDGYDLKKLIKENLITPEKAEEVKQLLERFSELRNDAYNSSNESIEEFRAKIDEYKQAGQRTKDKIQELMIKSIFDASIEITPSEHCMIVDNAGYKKLNQVKVTELFISKYNSKGIRFPNPIKITVKKPINGLILLMLSYADEGLRNKILAGKMVFSGNDDLYLKYNIITDKIIDIAGNLTCGSVEIQYSDEISIKCSHVNDVMRVILGRDDLPMPTVWSAPIISITEESLSGGINFVQVVVVKNQTKKDQANVGVKFLYELNEEDKQSWKDAISTAAKLCPEFKQEGKAFWVGKESGTGPSGSGAVLCALIAAMTKKSPIKGKIVSSAFKDGKPSTVGGTRLKKEICEKYGYKFSTVKRLLGQEETIQFTLEDIKDKFKIDIPVFEREQIPSVKADLKEKYKELPELKEVFYELDQLEFKLSGECQDISTAEDIKRIFFPEGEYEKIDNEDLKRIYTIGWQKLDEL